MLSRTLKIFSGILLTLSSCTQGPEQNRTQTLTADNTNQSSSESYPAGCETQHTVYQYEPAVSTLTGTLKKERFWGPPGYGEDTTVDAREICFVLELNKQIQVEADSANEFNTTQNNVMKIQLLSDTKLNSWQDKPVMVKGTLFGAQTGHHHTDVLLSVTEIQTCP